MSDCLANQIAAFACIEFEVENNKRNLKSERIGTFASMRSGYESQAQSLRSYFMTARMTKNYLQ